MDKDDDRVGVAVDYLQAQTDALGVGVVTVNEGSFFMFTAATLRALLERAEASDKKQAVVYVKRQGVGN